MDLNVTDKIQVTCGSGQGKTHFVVREALLRDGSPFNKSDVVIFLCINEVSKNQPECKQLRAKSKAKIADVKLPEDAEQEAQLFEAFQKTHDGGKVSTIVFDDQLVDAKAKIGKRTIERVFIAGRHMRLGCILIEQSPMANRLARMNTDVFALFDTSLASAIAHLARELHPESRGKRVMQCYRQSTKTRHGFLMVDARPDSSDRKFRDSSFNKVYDFSIL